MGVQILIVSGSLAFLSVMFLGLACVKSRLPDDRLQFFAFFLSLRSLLRLRMVR